MRVNVVRRVQEDGHQDWTSVEVGVFVPTRQGRKALDEFAANDGKAARVLVSDPALQVEGLEGVCKSNEDAAHGLLHFAAHQLEFLCPACGD